MSRSTSMADVSSPAPPHSAQRMCQTRCSRPDWCAAMTADGAKPGAARLRPYKPRNSVEPCDQRRAALRAPRRLSACHDYRRADAHPLEKVEDVLIVHADAAIGDEAADGAWHVGAMDRVLPAAQGERGRAHGIGRRSAGNHVGYVWSVALDLIRR